MFPHNGWYEALRRIGGVDPIVDLGVAFGADVIVSSIENRNRCSRTAPPLGTTGHSESVLYLSEKQIIGA